MKLIHTSDWHLGHTLYNYEREDEQLEMLNQLVAVVSERQPDLFLLSGDVYHTSQPSAATQTLFAEAVVRLHEACPSMAMVITAGNHDSASKHEIFQKPWLRLGVHAVGNLEKSEEMFDRHIVELPRKGFVVALPYCHERNLPDGVFQRLLDEVAARNREGLPVVMMAHTTVRGCDFAGHEDVTELSVGGIDGIDLESMGKGYDYLALGHIHHPQYVRGSRKQARYSGSPLAVSFDESYPHSVSLVEIDALGMKPRVEEVVLSPLRPLVTLPAEGFATWEEAKALLKAFPVDIPAYIRLNVEVDDFLSPEANAEAEDLTAGKCCRFCLINVRRKCRQERTEEVRLTVGEFQAQRPIDMARRYAADIGIDFSEEMEELFREVEQALEEDRRTT